MSIIVKAVFKATVGLIVKKCRDKLAEKFKDGDVTKQLFRGLVVRELDEIKSKLVDISRKDLGASMSYFKEGIEILYDVFEEASVPGELLRKTEVDAIGLASEIATAGKTELDLSELKQSTLTMLSKAQGMFRDARRRATEAFNNNALPLTDRLLAMEYRVMATILESVDNYMQAFPSCRVCLEELHALSEVQSNFKVQLQKGLLATIASDARKEVVFTVCSINAMIYDVFRARNIFASWPYISMEGGKKVDPLRDISVAKCLYKAGLEHYTTPCYAFGKEKNDGPVFMSPCCVTSNTRGDVIVVDNWDRHDPDRDDPIVTVFDTVCNMRYSVSPKYRVSFEKIVRALATDKTDNIYLLVTQDHTVDGQDVCLLNVLYVFDNDGEHIKTLNLGKYCENYLMAINDEGNIFLCGYKKLYVYRTDGQFTRSFDAPFHIQDITSGHNGCVLVLDHEYNVHFFTEHNQELNKISLKSIKRKNVRVKCVFHRQTEQLVCVQVRETMDSEVSAGIFSMSGVFNVNIHSSYDICLVNYSPSIPLDQQTGITVTPEGRIVIIDRNYCQVYVI